MCSKSMIIPDEVFTFVFFFFSLIIFIDPLDLIRRPCFRESSGIAGLLVPTFIDIAAHPLAQRSRCVPYSSDHSRLPLWQTAGCTASRR